MYTKRTPSTVELLYISRAQQRIAELSALTAKEIAVNDVTYKYIELVKELDYSIEALYSGFLDWSEHDIQMMMDYYTVHASLAVFGNKVVIMPGIIPTLGQIWATVPQLNKVDSESKDRDSALLTTLTTEITRLETIIAGLEFDAGGVILADIVVRVNVGGILMPRTYLAGTTYEKILRDLLSAPSAVKNLAATGHSSVVEANASMSITQFTWGVDGVPVNLRLSDSEGILTNVSVSGTGYTPPSPVNYTLAGTKTITWTLSGDNVAPITLRARSFYKSYYGKQAASNNTPLAVTSASILASTTFSIVDTAQNVTLLANTSNTEQGWIAVHKAQTGTSYTKWKVDEYNFSNIEVGEFILPPVDVTVNGVVYSVYRWGYRSPLVLPLTLHK